jgi:2-iminobutanoate/2-iminopropanoate deaminase
VRRERLGGADVALRTVVVDALLRPDALLEVEVVAARPERAGQVVHLPSITGQGPTLDAQVRAALELAAAMLGAVGLGLGHVVSTIERTLPATRSEYRATADVRRELLGPTFPAATGVLASRLEAEGSLISLDVTAAAAPKRTLDPGPLTFAPAVRADDLVWLSGTVALDPATGRAREPGDVAAQAEIVYAELGRLVRALGGTGLGDLVETVEYVAPAARASYRGVGDVRRRLLGASPPASTGVVVAGLLQPDWLLEVNGVAALAGP